MILWRNGLLGAVEDLEAPDALAMELGRLARNVREDS